MAIRKLNLNIDHRTSALSDQAVVCRSLGHSWERRSQSVRRQRELAAQGLCEIERYCKNSCGSTWRVVWNVREQVIVEQERVYPKNGAYLLPPGSGRLRRADAISALFARENPAYA